MRHPQTEQIAGAFGQAAAVYEKHGKLQQLAAKELGRYLPSWLQPLPPGPVLELGCGTGLVSRLALPYWKDREVHLSDLSPEMLKQAQANLPTQPGLRFAPVDANQPLAPNQFSCVLSSLAIQWLENPLQQSLVFAQALKPGGKLVLSFLGDQSFAQWRTATETLGLPYTANPLPDGSLLCDQLRQLPGELEVHEKTLPLTYPDPIDFFRHFKKIGAQVKIGPARLSHPQFMALLGHLKPQNQPHFTMDHQLFYLCYQAPL